MASDGAPWINPVLKDCITWMLVVGGWGIVHFCTERREKKKELRSSVREAINDIQKLEQLAFEYHKSSKREEANEHELLIQLDKLAALMQFLEKRLGDISVRVDDLHSAITDYNFQTCKFSQQQFSSPVLATIRWEARALTKSLYRHL